MIVKFRLHVLGNDPPLRILCRFLKYLNLHLVYLLWCELSMYSSLKWCLLLFYIFVTTCFCSWQTENGLVEAVAVLISKMPRMRADLGAEKLGECYKNKPDFMKVNLYICFNLHLFSFEEQALLYRIDVLSLLGLGEMASSNYKARLQCLLASMWTSSNKGWTENNTSNHAGKFC